MNLMKLHRNLALAITAGLKDILLNHKHADQTVEHLLRANKKWGSRDRDFVAGNIYHIVRFKRLYQYCCEEQIISESSLWKIFGVKLLLENFELPEWSEFL